MNKKLRFLFFLVIKGSVGGARELTGGNQIFLQWNWSFVAKQKNSVPTLVWTNSAQMMQPYLPLAVALPGLSQFFVQQLTFSLLAVSPSLEVVAAVRNHLINVADGFEGDPGADHWPVTSIHLCSSSVSSSRSIYLEEEREEGENNGKNVG